MSLLDYVVLIGSMAAIAFYGIWRTRGRRNLPEYLKGDRRVGWGTIGLSVMATQASAITFISTPGQGYQSGVGFVQFYFGLPLALIIVAAVFVPLYRRLNVYTAYEFLGRRFDGRTRLLGAGLFLLQRGLAAGITIYAPAIILSTMLGWPLNMTILLTGFLVIFYTVLGGSQAVNITQKYQMGIIISGMAAALVLLLLKLPRDVSWLDALTVAGGFDKLEAVDFSLDTQRRYTFWSGLLGGLFLSLSYFGTDQSQVQRYLAGGSLRESRLGLMFNAVLKVPMQTLILLLGVMLFVFYQFERPPLFFNTVAWNAAVERDNAGELRSLEQEFARAQEEKEGNIRAWLAAREGGDAAVVTAARLQALASQERVESVRERALAALERGGARTKSSDSDYVFITFILDHLPHGVIGLLMAVFFAAALSSESAELNALGTTTVVDIYRHLIRPAAAEAHYLAASKWFTFLWGLVALGFALFANLVENLIQAINIVGSIFYGVMLALFVVAFFLRRVGGVAVFWAALTAQALVFVLYFSFTDHVAYLWYNLIGCAVCVLISLLLQAVMGSGPGPAAAGRVAEH